MRKVLFIFLLIMKTTAFALSQAPSQKVADEWIQMALSLPPEWLTAQHGSYRCQTAVPLSPEENFVAHAPTAADAQTKIVLICIQYQCKNLDRLVSEGRRLIQELPENELTELLYSLGFSPVEILQTLVVRKSALAVNVLPPVTCAKASPLARGIFDQCMSPPLLCGEVR